MKKAIILILIVFCYGCSTNSKQVSQKKSNSTDRSALANNSDLYCKKTKKTGTRMNTRNCITQEQRKRERRESVDAMRNATNTQGNIVPGASNK